MVTFFSSAQTSRPWGLKTLVGFSLAVCLATPVLAKVGFVNTERVLRESPPAVAAQKKLEAEFAKREKMMLVIAPEGTRSAVEGWKKGYHHIALAAGVPIVPVALDFGQRRVLIGEPLLPRDDYAADYTQLKSFFRADMARHPENFR